MKQSHEELLAAHEALLNEAVATMSLADKFKAICHWQGDAYVHPLTCGADCKPPLRDDFPLLPFLLLLPDSNAMQMGLRCPHCDYTQEWVPDIVYKHWYHDMRSKEGFT